jgi:hypothetical protein
VPEKLATLVHYLRREKVILDSDLAQLYGVETGALNRAVKRNIERFPADFMFQLTAEEETALRCQTGILNADHDQQFQLVFEAIKQLIAAPAPPAKELGFHTISSAHSAKKPPPVPKPDRSFD